MELHTVNTWEWNSVLHIEPSHTLKHNFNIVPTFRSNMFCQYKTLLDISQGFST